jgi:hypothetical protein
MSIGFSNIAEKPCGCRYDEITGMFPHFCEIHSRDLLAELPFEIDIDKVREQLAAEKALNARLTARIAILESLDATRLMNAQVLNALEFVGLNCCRWRAECKCLLDCPGSVVCNTSGLALVDDNGQPVGERP